MTVKQLIEHLQKFDLDKPIIVDVDGNTFPMPKPQLWNFVDPQSPVAIYLHDVVYIHDGDD